MLPRIRQYANRAKIQETSNKVWNNLMFYKRGVIIGVGTFCGVAGTTWVCWPWVRTMGSKTTTDVLNDQNVHTTATKFSKEITNELLQAKDTYSLSCQLILKVLRDEQVKNESIVFFKSLINDNTIQQELAKLVDNILAQPQVQERLIVLIHEIYHDEAVEQETQEFGKRVVTDQSVVDTLASTLKAASKQLLNDPQMQTEASKALRGSLYKIFKIF